MALAGPHDKQKQHASRPRQITMSIPHHLIFTVWKLFLCPTISVKSTEDIKNKSYTVHNKYGSEYADYYMIFDFGFEAF